MSSLPAPAWMPSDGTMETGLNLLDRRTGRFQHFQHRAGDGSSLPTDAVHSLYVDVAGALWVGTHSGLSQLQPDGQSFRTYTTRNGLPSDVVYAIANDRQGRLWLSTNNGLAAFDPRTGESVNYGVSNGLQARDGPESRRANHSRRVERLSVLRRFGRDGGARHAFSRFGHHGQVYRHESLALGRADVRRR